VHADRRLRTLIVSQYYPPENVGMIVHSVAIGLQARGHDVTVLTAFPNHPVGRVLPGWKQRFGHVERRDGVTVHRVPMLPDHSDRAFARVIAYLSFALSTCSASKLGRDADVVYVYSAQPTVGIAPMRWRRRFRTPYVLHVQDIWPESVTGSGMIASGWATRAVARGVLWWLRSVHRAAAHVIAIAPGAAALLTDRGADPDRTTSLLNWVEPGSGDVVRHVRDDGRTRIVYAGTLGPNQGLDTVVRAAARCGDLGDLEFVVIGTGVVDGHLRALAAQLGAGNIAFRAPVPAAQMPEVHADADFEIVSLADAPMAAVTVPSKLQQALGHGVPVIAALSGDAADLVSDGGAGIVVPPGDVDRLEAAFRRAHATSGDERRRLSANALAVVAEHMDGGVALDRVDQILRKAAR